MRRLLMLTSLLLICPLPLFARQAAPDTEALTAVMQAPPPMARPAFRGIAVIAEQGRLRWNYSDRSLPLTAQQQFVTGSQSKQITAALVLRAVDEQRLALTDPLSKYLPDQQSRYGDAVQIRHLLEHSSGIEQPKQSPLYPPGQTFAYSNAGYDLLGTVLERIYAQPYARLAGALFRRCGLGGTFAPTPQQLTSQAARLVHGLQEQQGELVPAPLDAPVSNNPSGRIVSTAGDLLAWQQCLHQDGLLSAASHQQLVSPRLPRRHRYGELSYGYGLQISTADGLLEWSHSGYVAGYISTTLYYPAFALGVVVLEAQSLQPQDMARTFYYHDLLRRQLRQQLLAGPRSHSGE